MRRLVSSEPVATAFGALIVAVCGVLVAFGVDLTGEQVGALSGVGVAAVGLAVAVRRCVTPNRKKDR